MLPLHHQCLLQCHLFITISGGLQMPVDKIPATNLLCWLWVFLFVMLKDITRLYFILSTGLFPTLRVIFSYTG